MGSGEWLHVFFTIIEHCRHYLRHLATIAGISRGPIPSLLSKYVQDSKLLGLLKASKAWYSFHGKLINRTLLTMTRAHISSPCVSAGSGHLQVPRTKLEVTENNQCIYRSNLYLETNHLAHRQLLWFHFEGFGSSSVE